MSGVFLEADVSGAMRAFALTALLFAPTIALAQDEGCDQGAGDCGCESNWGCWEVFFASKGSVLGVEGGLTRVATNEDERFEASFLAAYATEHYATQRHVTGHFRAYGSIGAGTAGTEGGIGGTLDFGYRLTLTEQSGPFARIGAQGAVLGNDALRLSAFEPAQGRLGYQFLDGDTLIESGLTGGIVAVGSYGAGDRSGRPLGPGAELGAYAALHVSAYRFDAEVSQLQATDSGPPTPVDLVRLGVCGYLKAAALCGSLLFVRGDIDVGHGAFRRVSSLHLGVTLGLTP